MEKDERKRKKTDVKEFGNKFRDFDEFTISKLIDELSHLREEKYKERKNEHMRIISLGLNDFIKKCKYEVVAISRQMEAAIQDKKFIDGGCARECSLYGGVTSAVAHPATLGLDPADIKLDLAARNKNDRLKNHFDAFSVAYYDIFNKCSICERKEELDRQTTQNGSGNDGGASGSQGRQKPMPNCEVCKKLPRSPHAVYCCGAMYCQDCLLSIMSQAQQRGEQPMCINPTCQKPMGEKPQVKTKRGQQVAEDTRPIASQREGTPRLDSAEPQPKIARVMNQSGPALFNQMGQPLTATVLRPQRAGAAPIPTFVSNVTGQIVQPGQYSRAMFHAGATAEPVLSGGSRIQGPRSNVSSGRNTPVGSLPSLPVTEHGRPFAKPANETSTTTMMAPNSAESCPSIAIASAGTQSSNGRVPLQPAVKSEMAKKVMENEYMPRIPNPYEIEERRKLEKENDERKREKAYVEDDPGIVGPTCQKCNKLPRQPHSAFCCGDMYCQYCVMTVMSENQQKEERPYCINLECQKVMGHAPPQKTNKSTEGR